MASRISAKDNCGFILVEELKRTFGLNYKRFLDRRRLNRVCSGQRRKNSLTDPEPFRRMRGLMRTDWTRVSHIEALLQADHLLCCDTTERHVPLLCWGNASTHLLRAGLSADDLWSCFIAFSLSGTTPYVQPSVTAWCEVAVLYSHHDNFNYSDHCEKSGEIGDLSNSLSCIWQVWNTRGQFMNLVNCSTKVLFRLHH